MDPWQATDPRAGVDSLAGTVERFIEAGVREFVVFWPPEGDAGAARVVPRLIDGPVCGLVYATASTRGEREPRPSADYRDARVRSAHYEQVKRRRGHKKAVTAVAHSILIAAHHILKDDVPYQDLGGDYFARRADPERLTNRLVAQLEQLGHTSRPRQRQRQRPRTPRQP